MLGRRPYSWVLPVLLGSKLSLAQGNKHTDPALYFFIRLDEFDMDRIVITSVDYLSCDMRKPAFCMCENKDTDQLRGNLETDQHLCFRYLDSTIPLLPKSEISSL